MASSSDIEETLREGSQQLPEQHITGQELLVTQEKSSSLSKDAWSIHVR